MTQYSEIQNQYSLRCSASSDLCISLLLQIAEFFFLGNLGQLALIAVYLLLNGLLMGLGTLS